MLKKTAFATFRKKEDGTKRALEEVATLFKVNKATIMPPPKEIGALIHGLLVASILERIKPNAPKAVAPL